MVDQKLRFIAEWVDKGLKRGAADAGKQMSGIGKTMSSLGSAIQANQGFLLGLAGAATGAAVAMKKIYEIGKEGAQLELTAIRFDRLAESIGTTGDALREDLSAATDGLMSDAQQMALATEIVGLGLTKNADQTVRLARVVSQLGADMNQVTLTLANRTTMRFDQIGIAIDGFDERLQGLIDSGMSAEDAFTEAFLQQGEAQLEKIGSVADTSAGAFMRFEAQIANVWDGLKMMVGIELAPFVNELAQIVELAANDDISRLQANWLVTKSVFTDTTDELAELNREANYTNELIDIQERRAALAEEQWRNVTGATEEAAEAQENLADSIDDVNLGLDNQILKWIKQHKALKNGIKLTEQAAEATREKLEKNLISASEAYDLLTYYAVQAAIAMGEFEGMDYSDIVRQLQRMGIPLQEAAQWAASIYAYMLQLDGMVATITVQGQTVNIPSQGSIIDQINQEITESGIPTWIRQAGGDFIVPPWYTNDTFPVRASAGERVRVDTKSGTLLDMLRERHDSRIRDERLANMIVEGIVAGLG